jgi:hypothetical protein
MTSELRHSHVPPPGGPAPSERNRWFTGKYMGAREFALDPDYLRGRHQLHNRLLHGHGIVLGLSVEPHPREDCRDRWVVVRCGIALDCYGRELVLERDATPYELPLLRPPEDQRQEKDGRSQDEEKVWDGPFLLCLRYCEEEIDPVPAPNAENGCGTAHQDNNRVRETAELVVADDDPRCWKGPSPRPDAYDRGHGHARTAGRSCLAPDCPCGDLVPLARITPRPDAGDGEPRYQIDLSGRRRLPEPSSLLTHISWTSWRHGQEVHLGDLRRHPWLEIAFDQDLAEPDEDDPHTGVNRHTFVVQYSQAQRALEFLPAAGPPALVAPNRAVFEIDPDVLARDDNIGNSVVHVSLKCDFLLDCRGVAVDGNHIGGRLPSGNGTPGGIFESWFRVTDRDGYGGYEEAR